MHSLKLGQILTSLLLAFAVTESVHAAKAPVPTDAEIAHIVVTANSIDVTAGKLALKKAKDKEIKKFAQQMVTDHSMVNKEAKALAKKLHVTPKYNAISRSLMVGAKKNMAKLHKLKGRAFDVEYINHEVAYHQAVLDAIDHVLVPSAKNQELKSLIEKVRPAIAEHLQHAKSIQSEFR